MKPCVTIAALALTMAAQAQAQTQDLRFTVPSGIEVQLLDRIVEQQAGGETWMTLRFLTPAIGKDAGKLGYEQVAGDLDYLCDVAGLRAAAETGGVDQVLIALMDRVIERGSMDPEATMFIGAYLPTKGGCVFQ